MSEGYDLLENGKWNEAIEFFNEVIDQYPENKTANICLGRAIGLAGNPTESLKIFAEAYKIYPDDFELNLNIAEAYLWNDLPDKSLDVYLNLLEIDKNHFTANLGIANCYFVLQDFEKANDYINIASEIEPLNSNLNSSKKYILLGLANQKSNEFDFLSAIKILNLILEFMPFDEQTLINRGVNFIKLGKYKAAEEDFQLLIEQQLNTFEAHKLLSHLYMLKHQYKKAILEAEKAVVAADEKNEIQIIQANIQLVNALAAAKEFKNADRKVDDLINRFGDKEMLHLAKARIKVWDREPEKGLEIYNELSNSYELCMGKAEAYIALNNEDEALHQLNEALLYNPHSLDVHNLKSKCLQNQKINIELEANRSSDIALNEATEFHLRLMKNLNSKHQIYFHTGMREAVNQLSSSKANQFQMFIADRYRINAKWLLNMMLGAVSSENGLGRRSLNRLSSLDLEYKLNKNHSLRLAYFQESLKYSSDLIKSGLLTNKITASYQFHRPKWPGFVAQMSKSTLSDKNGSFSMFSSFYYEVKSFPLVKIGINVNYLTFELQKALEYFSPEEFGLAEVFGSFGNIYNEKAKFSYLIQVAFGKQKINNRPIESSQRLQLSLAYKFKSKFTIKVNYFTNTAANANLKAHSFQKFGICLNYTL